MLIYLCCACEDEIASMYSMLIGALKELWVGLHNAASWSQRCPGPGTEFKMISAQHSSNNRPLQKRERTGKEYGCFPFV